MLKDVKSCALCGKVAPREELILYHFPEGPKLVCKTCYRQLPPDPANRIKGPFKRKPGDDIFPPIK